jgi:hypothetical protein
MVISSICVDRVMMEQTTRASIAMMIADWDAALN